MMMGNRICVPNADDLRRELLQERHSAPYAIYLGETKT